MKKTQQQFVVSQNIPEFIKTDDNLFSAFIEAYYDWLETQNDSESSSYADVWRAVGNPGYLANNNELIIDVDKTIDEFIEYFSKSVVPFSIENIKSDPAFLLKKSRELYLAKGTDKSFKLFFKLFFNSEIDIFESRDTILRASAGTYFSFPTTYAYVTQFQNKLEDIDFAFSTITDDSDNFVGTLLSADIIDRLVSGENVLQLKISTETDLERSRSYFITDGQVRIKIRPMSTISNVIINEGGALFKERDQIVFSSISENSDFYGSVSGTEAGRVTAVNVRDRGFGYSLNDVFRFTDGRFITGSVKPTKVDEKGSIEELNGIGVRTGDTNLGLLSSEIEEVRVPVIVNKLWKELPTVEYTPAVETRYETQPYGNAATEGYGLQIVPYSDTIGKVTNINIDGSNYFVNDSDISFSAPRTAIVGNPDLVEGDKVAFLVFDENNLSFIDRDSDIIRITYDFPRRLVTDELGRTFSEEITYKVRVPYAFDSELADWIIQEVDVTPVVSTDGVLAVRDDINENSNFDTTITTYNAYYGIDGGTSFVQTLDSEFSGGSSYDETLIGELDGGPTWDFSYQEDRFTVIQFNDDNASTWLSSLNIAYDSENTDFQFNAFDSENAVSASSITIDSDKLIYKWTNIYLKGDSELAEDLLLFRSEQIPVPVSYDSDLMTWTTKEIAVTNVPNAPNPDVLNDVIALYDSSNISNTYTTSINVQVDSDQFENRLVVSLTGQYLSQFDDFQFNRLFGINDEFITQDGLYTYDVIYVEPNFFLTSDVGNINWKNTGYYADVKDVSGNVVTFNNYKDYPILANEELEALSEDVARVVIAQKVDINDVPELEEGIPLNNVIYSINVLDISVETSVASNAAKQFFTEDGFISSAFGGTIQDNFYFSDWTYRIKTVIPFEDWRNKFKEMLHPSGLVLTADLNRDHVIETGVGISEGNTLLIERSNATFDMQQEFVSAQQQFGDFFADSTIIRSNGGAIFAETLDELRADYVASSQNDPIVQQNGNAFWDAEPVGLVSKQVDPTPGGFPTYINYSWPEDHINKVTTQDSEGIYVGNNSKTYNRFNNNTQDLFKSNRRSMLEMRSPTVSYIRFNNSINDVFVHYDSELPFDVYPSFSADSEYIFRSIDYSRIKTNVSDTNYYGIVIPRTSEILRDKALDLNLAMQERRSLSFMDGGVTYYDYEAYERKWNTINSQRTLNNEGYNIKGINQFVANTFNQTRSERRKLDITDFTDQLYSNTNAPHNFYAWNVIKDAAWTNNYINSNSTVIVDLDYDKNEDSIRDPQIAMRNRRGS